jgi:hypothetical protein
MDNPLDALFSLFGSRLQNDNYEPFAPLSKEESKEWEDIQNEVAKVKSLVGEVEARKKLFWVKIEKKTNLYNRTLKIENGMILVEVKEKNSCPTPGIARPGFCVGDCADCALNPTLTTEE